MIRMQRRFAWIVLSLLIFQAAAPEASSLSLSMFGRSALRARTCACCCTGAAICLCQKRHGQTENGEVTQSKTTPCRSLCRSSQPPTPALGISGVLITPFEVSPTLTFIGLSIRLLSTFSPVILPVPAPPPRETSSQI
jgi:hypothetical protein